MRCQTRRGEAGFTLVELMIVVSLVGILAAVAIPSFRHYQWKAKRAEAYANLGSLAKSQKAYYSIYDVYFGTFPEPFWTSGVAPTSITRDSSPIATTFASVGWKTEGQVFFDYDTNTGGFAGAGCTCVKCFTLTAYGDVDGDNSQSAVMYVHPDGAGGECKSTMFGYTTPVDATFQPLYDTIAVNASQDDF